MPAGAEVVVTLYMSDAVDWAGCLAGYDNWAVSPIDGVNEEDDDAPPTGGSGINHHHNCVLRSY